jgi:hypothetical protein
LKTPHHTVGGFRMSPWFFEDCQPHVSSQSFCSIPPFASSEHHQ